MDTSGCNASWATIQKARTHSIYNIHMHLHIACTYWILKITQ